MIKSKTFKLEHKNGVYTCELIADSRCRSVHVRVEPTVDERYLVGPRNHAVSQTDVNQETLFPEYKPGRAYIVRVTHPTYLRRKQVIQTVVDHSAWIEAEMSRLQTTSVTFSQRVLTNGTPIPYLGRQLPLCIFSAATKHPRVELTDKALLCYAGSISQKEIRVLIEKWFRQATLNLVKERIDRLAVGVTNKDYRVTVRSQRSRWGSCSQNGSLCFNWKLAMMPSYVIDYLIVHELAHLEEFNHSKRYWKIVREKYKGVTKAKTWLKKFGPTLD